MYHNTALFYKKNSTLSITNGQFVLISDSDKAGKSRRLMPDILWQNGGSIVVNSIVSCM